MRLGVVGHKDEKICRGQVMMVFIYSVKELGCYSLDIVEDLQTGQFTWSCLYERCLWQNLRRTSFMGLVFNVDNLVMRLFFPKLNWWTELWY